MQARAKCWPGHPSGNYVMIKGSPTDPERGFPARRPARGAARAAIDAGDITIVGEAYTDQWLPANAQRNMEQILTANDNNVDAVVASNDGTAGGVVAALTAQGMAGIPVSGQDGDHAALNRVAKGTQSVSVWKDARDLGRAAGEIAVAMAGGTGMADIPGAVQWTSPSGNVLWARFLAPVPVTQENLTDRRGRRLDPAQETLCQGVEGGPGPLQLIPTRHGPAPATCSGRVILTRRTSMS
jgi:D-xylose transport system substrate-binding protein